MNYTKKQKERDVELLVETGYTKAKAEKIVKQHIVEAEKAYNQPWTTKELRCDAWR